MSNERRSPPAGKPQASEIILPEPPRQPPPLRCPYPEDYDDSGEYGELINH
jgi:hypothetical protein